MSDETTEEEPETEDDTALYEAEPPIAPADAGFCGATIRVVKVNGLRTAEQRASACYVGRAFAGWPASPWGNPFKPRPSGFTLEVCLGRFRSFAESSPPEYLADLWEACEHGAKPLGCFCVDWDGTGEPPIVCHAVILASMLKERFCSSSTAR